MSARGGAGRTRRRGDRLEVAAAGVVFDLDGTMVDNMGLHADAFAEFARRRGLPGPAPGDRARFDGRRNADIFPAVLGRPLAPAELAEVVREKEGLYRESSRGLLEPLRGLVALLDALAARGVPVAIATSAPAENVRHTLEEIGLFARGLPIVRGDDVPHGKPAPDVFLAAARLLGVAPERCLAFEDAPVGVAAAVAAGMACVAVATSHAEAFAACDPPPHAVVRDFREYLDRYGAWL